MIVDCAPSALWPWIEDPERNKQWLEGVERAEPVTPGPRRVGSVTKIYIREGRKLGEYRQTLLEHVPERRFKMRMEGGCLRGSAMVNDYVLVDLGDGRTRLEYECTAELVGWMRVMGPLFKLMGAMQVRKFFRTLKALAEGGARTSAA